MLVCFVHLVCLSASRSKQTKCACKTRKEWKPPAVETLLGIWSKQNRWCDYAGQ